MRARKKVVEVEFELFTRHRYEKVKAFVGPALSPMSIHRTLHAKAFCFIETLEGKMKATEGDYIIKGVNGEFYPCKPDIFEKTYEKLN